MQAFYSPIDVTKHNLLLRPSRKLSLLNSNFSCFLLWYPKMFIACSVGVYVMCVSSFMTGVMGVEYLY